MPLQYDENFDLFYNDLIDIITKYKNYFNNFVHEKILIFQINNCEINISIKRADKENKEKNIIHTSFNKNEIKETQKKEKINTNNIYQNFLKENKPLYNENESKNDNSFKKKTRSLQKNKDLKFNNNILDKNKEKEKKSKYSNSLEKIKEINKDEKPKGLYNLGLNCYMNSLIQCLFYIKEFREYFIENEKDFGDEKPICRAFAEVMNKLKYDEKDYVNPIRLKKLLGQSNSLFLVKKAADVKDLFFNLIDIFITELNQDNNDNSNVESYSSEINFCNKKITFQESLKEIEQNNNIINELFIGYYEIGYFCKQKRKYTYSFQTESFIIFELEKIQNYFKTNKFSLKQCFEYYSRKKENSSFYCHSCKKTHNGNEYQKIYRPPKILVLILDRGHGKSFRGTVDISKEIELKDIIDEENYIYNTTYNLICISTREGESSSKEHYTSCCLNENNKFYYFSDTYVKEINDNNLYHDEPYLLFYRQADINEEQNIRDNKEKKININKNDEHNNTNNFILMNKESNKKQDENQNIKNYSIYNKYKKNGYKDGNKCFETDKNINNTDNSILNKNYQDSNKPQYNNKKLNSHEINYQEIYNTFKIFTDQTNDKYKIEYYNENEYYNIYQKNIFYWKLIVNGPKDSLYEGGTFIFKVDLSKPFNKLSDIITIKTQFYHLNFGDKDSSLKFDVEYNNNISFYNNLKRLFNLIYNLLKEPDCELSKNFSPNTKLKEYKNNRDKYNENARNSILYILLKK